MPDRLEQLRALAKLDADMRAQEAEDARADADDRSVRAIIARRAERLRARFGFDQNSPQMSWYREHLRAWRRDRLGRG